MWLQMNMLTCFGTFNNVTLTQFMTDKIELASVVKSNDMPTHIK